MRPDSQDCPVCEGSGVLMECCDAPTRNEKYHRCDRCMSKSHTYTCPECDGIGWMTDHEKADYDMEIYRLANTDEDGHGGF